MERVSFFLYKFVVVLYVGEALVEREKFLAAILIIVNNSLGKV